MIRITISPTARNIARMKAKGPQIVQTILTKVSILMEELATYVRSEKLSGQVLTPRTGVLRGSVRVIPTEAKGTLISGGVTEGGPTWRTGLYARVQEHGGTHPYDIVASKKRMLAFMVGDNKVFARRVSHPPLPARPFMRTSEEENKERMIAELKNAVNKVIKE